MLDLCLIHLHSRRTVLLKTVLFLLVGFLSLPQSHSWAAPPSKGIKIGSKGRFHPRLYLNAGYNNNIFHRSYQSEIRSAPGLPFADIKGAGLLSIRPGLQLYIPSESVVFELGGYANYSHFFNFTTLNTVTAKADLGVTFFPRSVFSVTLKNNFSRSSGDTTSANDMFARTMFNYAPGTQVGSAFITHNNETSLLFSIKPKGGALRFDLGYKFGFGLYPSADLDYHSHNISFDVKWSFFPRTAFTFDSSFKIVNYAPRFNLSQSSANNDLKPLKIYVGVIGQLTDRILLTLRLGGGYSFTSTAANANVDNYGMLLGNIDFTYKFRLTTFLRLGFRHDFHESGFADYYSELYGYAEFGAQFGQTRPFVLSLRGDLGYLLYGKIEPNRTSASGTVTTRFISTSTDADGYLNRKDFMLRGNVDLDWFAFPYWLLGISARLTYVNSNTYFLHDNGNNKIGFGYFEFQAIFKTELAF